MQVIESLEELFHDMAVGLGCEALLLEVDLVQASFQEELHNYEYFVVTLEQLQDPSDVDVIDFLKSLELRPHDVDHVLTNCYDLGFLDDFDSTRKASLLVYAVHDLAKSSCTNLSDRLVVVIESVVACKLGKLANISAVYELACFFPKLRRRQGNYILVALEITQVSWLEIAFLLVGRFTAQSLITHSKILII